MDFNQIVDFAKSHIELPWGWQFGLDNNQVAVSLVDIQVVGLDEVATVAAVFKSSRGEEVIVSTIKDSVTADSYNIQRISGNRYVVLLEVVLDEGGE